jgi:O-antigen ligase
VLSLPRHKVDALRIALLGVALAAVVVMAPPQVWDRLGTLTRPFTGEEEAGTLVDESVDLRLGAQAAAQEMFLTSPLVGIGAGNFPPRYVEFTRDLGVRSLGSEFPTHNLYLEVLAEEGLLGLIALGFALLSAPLWLLRVWRSLPTVSPRDHDLRELSFGLLIAIAGYLAGSFFLHSAFFRYYWILLALVVCAAREAEILLRARLRLSVHSRTPLMDGLPAIGNAGPNSVATAHAAEYGR